MLLIALVVDNIDEAVESMIHIWYSSLIRKSDLDTLEKRICPLIEDVCQKIKDKSPTSLLGKTWKFKQRSLRLVLMKSSWNTVLSLTRVPEGLTADRANDTRTSVTLAKSRRDYRDRHLFVLSPSHRIAKNQFWVDGLLLPLGHPLHDFEVPNP